HRDTSVRVNAKYLGSDHENAEFVYRGYENTDNIMEPICKAIRIFREKELIYNDTCGIHIHSSQLSKDIIERTGRTWDLYNLLKVCKFYIDIEDLFYSFIPKNRATKKHSKKMVLNNENFYYAIKNMPARVIDNIPNFDTNTIKEMIGNMWYNKTDYSYNAGHKYDNSRYLGFNVHSFFYRGTLEFRQFDGDYNMLPRFVDFIDKIFNFIENNTAESIELFIRNLNTISDMEEKLEKLLSRLNVSPKTKEIFIKRAKKFNSEMFTEDYEPSEENSTRNTELHPRDYINALHERLRERESTSEYENVFEETHSEPYLEYDLTEIINNSAETRRSA
ncbi:MAG: amidoligase family protein, partial [archaeon]